MRSYIVTNTTVSYHDNQRNYNIMNHFGWIYTNEHTRNHWLINICRGSTTTSPLVKSIASRSPNKLSGPPRLDHQRETKNQRWIDEETYQITNAIIHEVGLICVPLARTPRSPGLLGRGIAKRSPVIHLQRRSQLVEYTAVKNGTYISM